MSENLPSNEKYQPVGFVEGLLNSINFFKHQTNKVINRWLEVLPTIEKYGLKITSFAMSYSINPSLEVELIGKSADFPIERIREILDENKSSASIVSVFQAVRTTKNLYEKTKSTPQEDLIIEIKVRFSPEIKVFLGVPLIE